MNDTDARRALAAIVAVVGRPCRDLKAVADALAAVRRIDTPVRRAACAEDAVIAALQGGVEELPEAVAILGGIEVSNAPESYSRHGGCGFSCPMCWSWRRRLRTPHWRSRPGPTRRGCGTTVRCATRWGFRRTMTRFLPRWGALRPETPIESLPARLPFGAAISPI